MTFCVVLHEKHNSKKTRKNNRTNDERGGIQEQDEEHERSDLRARSEPQRVTSTRKQITMRYKEQSKHEEEEEEEEEEEREEE